MIPEQVELARELAALRQAVRAAQRCYRQKTWRRAVVLRSARVSLVLRSVERAIGSRYLRREKGADRRWSVYARGDGGAEVLVALVGGGATRRLEDVQAPVQVEIIEASLVDLDGLRRATNREPPGSEEAIQ